MNSSLPPRPASFRLRHLVQLRPGPPRWTLSLSTALCIAAPVAAGWSFGDVPAGLIAAIGAFTGLYGADRPYRNRALMLAAIAVGFACAVALGVWSESFGRLGIAIVVAVAMSATFFCNALRVGPPGAYMFALAGAVGTGLPTQHLGWWQAGLLALAGGGFSVIVRLAGALVDAHGPERAAVSAAGTAVEAFLKAIGSPAEDGARHAAAVALHDTWTTLVSRQPARTADDGMLARLRSISRELHRLFIDGVNAGDRFTDRDARIGERSDAVLRTAIGEQSNAVLRTAMGEQSDAVLRTAMGEQSDAVRQTAMARARELAEEARTKAADSTREAPEHVPLGKRGIAESLWESLIWPSPVLVVSLRVGLAAAIAGLLGAALDLERVYWIVAAAVLVLHQGWDWSRSLQRGFERVIGTLFGLALAGAVLWLAPQGLWLALTLAALQFLIELVVVRNYALAVVFITAIALTMAAAGHHVPGIGLLLWDRAMDTVIGCAIGIGVLLVTAPRALAVPIPQELAAALKAAQELLEFAAAGDAVSAQAKRARRNLQHRAITLLTAYELGAGARPPDRRFAEELWPAVVAAQRLLYRLLAFCWALEGAGSDRAVEMARAEFGASGLASANTALDELSGAVTDGRAAAIPSDVPGFLKDDLEDLSGFLARRPKDAPL